MRGDRLSKIGVHLPLSENHEEIKESGTRHAAALGLSERADAMCVVVSEERSNARKQLVSTGDRSAKIRTYNFPQGRVTDHRINLTLYKLESILNGSLQEFIDSIKLEDQKLQLSEIES